MLLNNLGRTYLNPSLVVTARSAPEEIDGAWRIYLNGDIILAYEDKGSRDKDYANIVIAMERVQGNI